MQSEKFIYKILPRLVDCCTTRVLIQLRHLNRSWMYLIRGLSSTRITDKYSNRADKLSAFQAFLAYLPVQGSSEWLAQRAGTTQDYSRELTIRIHDLDPTYRMPPTIGGSELGQVLGEDTKYGTPFTLMRKKLGIEKFDGNIHTNWGKMLESVLGRWTEIVFNTTMIETGSVPGLRNDLGVPIQSYSPDGVGLVKLDRIRSVIEREDIKHTQTAEYQEFMTGDPERIVLFEFKCPLQRVPKGEVPSHYRAQPRLGMASLDIPEISIFGDAAFRKCRVEDFNFTGKYDASLPPTMASNLLKGVPLMIGFVGIYEAGARAKLGRVRGVVSDMHRITKDLILLAQNALSRKEYAGLPISVDLVTLVTALCYDSLMDGEYSGLEFADEDRGKIIWNAVKRNTTVLPADRNASLTAVANALRLIDLARRTYNPADVRVGTDLGYSRFDQNGSRGFGSYQVIELDRMQEILSERKPLSGEEFYSLIAHTNGQTDFKFYYPDKFCYQSTSPYAWDLSKMGDGNEMDINLRSPKQCRKWLYQNFKEFERFCFREGHRPIGVIPYKLMKLHYTPIYKEVDYLERHRPAIEDYQARIELVRSGTTDLTEIDQRICEMYHVAPVLGKEVEPNNFDDVPLVAVAEEQTRLNFDDIALIG